MSHCLSLLPIVDLGSAGPVGCRVRAVDSEAVDWLGHLAEVLPTLPGTLWVEVPLGDLESEALVALVRQVGADRMVLDLVEATALPNQAQLASVLAQARRLGVRVCFEDGDLAHLGLGALSQAAPDLLRLDPVLVCGCARNLVHQALLGAVLELCGDHGVRPLADEVADPEDARWLAEAGVQLQGGSFFSEAGSDGTPLVSREHLTAMASVLGAMRPGA